MGAGRIEYLHAVVARVGDGDPHAVRRPRRGNGLVELTCAVAGGSKPAGERAVGVEYLHAVVARVGDGDHARQRHGWRGHGPERHV